MGGKGFNTPMGHVGWIGSKAGQRGDGDGESEGMMVVCKPQVVGDGEKAHETESRESSNVTSPPLALALSAMINNTIFTR